MHSTALLSSRAISELERGRCTTADRPESCRSFGRTPIPLAGRRVRALRSRRDGPVSPARCGQDSSQPGREAWLCPLAAWLSLIHGSTGQLRRGSRRKFIIRRVCGNLAIDGWPENCDQPTDDRQCGKNGEDARNHLHQEMVSRRPRNAGLARLVDICFLLQASC